MAPGAQARVADVELLPLPADRAEYRRRVIFECFKWDPQVGDADTICDHACVLSRQVADQLSRDAEALAAETMALEAVLLKRPDLHAELGLRGKLKRVLARSQAAPSSVRVMRFDFHPTEAGWSVSEVNSDVPGGFAEASALSLLASEYLCVGRPGGDVAGALAGAVAKKAGAGARVGLVHATAYSDDRQVMQYLAGRFREVGCDPLMLAPDHLRWSEGRAVSIAEGQEGRVDAVVRFFPADWLPVLQDRATWEGFFSARVAMCNPPLAVLSQSKRLPVIWDELGVDTPAWKALLPETRDPREAPWRGDDQWVLKPALGRVGEAVAWRGFGAAKEWKKHARSAMLSPRSWVAQRRFQSRALPTRGGPRHLCVGVYTVDGRAAGFYGRLSDRAIIEKHAQDIAVLVG